MNPMIMSAGACYAASSAAYIGHFFSRQKKIRQIARILFRVAFIAHVVIVARQAFAVGQMPVRNLHETLLTAGLAVAVAFIVFERRLKLQVLGIFLAPLVALMIMSAAMIPSSQMESMRILDNFWLVFHILAIFMADAVLAAACGAGILYLLQEAAIKRKRPGFFFRRLPSLERLDQAGYTFVAVGFTLLTIGLITGVIYAKIAWGHFWKWDPKEVWSGITWLVYAVLLHERLTVGWRGRRSAIMAIIGFAVVLFTFFGVNFFMEGHHGIFTR